MKRQGLTEAMRRALSNLDGNRAVMERLCELGLIAWNNEGAGQDGWHYTPRGQAALAAPRMTAAELETLSDTMHASPRALERLRKRGWWDDGITPAGTTALNNIRAASGSPDWKEAK